MSDPCLITANTKNNKPSYLFENIARDLTTKGFSINPGPLPATLVDNLLLNLQQLNTKDFKKAGIGRHQAKMLNPQIRTDSIFWIQANAATNHCATQNAGKAWLLWSQALQQHLNRTLFLGLRSFESHFALYAPGEFYKRHLDAFQNQNSRLVSIIVYLNKDWGQADGGELVLYMDNNDQAGIKIVPKLGNLVVFMSHEFPHEVLPSNKDRFSLAGWFRTT